MFNNTRGHRPQTIRSAKGQASAKSSRYEKLTQKIPGADLSLAGHLVVDGARGSLFSDLVRNSHHRRVVSGSTPPDPGGLIE